jgi:hypothetical protein
MVEVLYEGDWQSPGVTPFKAGEAVLSRAAFDQLYELLGPKVGSAPRIRRPAIPERPEAPGPGLRRAPFPRP